MLPYFADMLPYTCGNFLVAIAQLPVEDKLEMRDTECLTTMFLIVIFNTYQSDHQTIHLLDGLALNLADLSHSSNVASSFFKLLQEKFARFAVSLSPCNEEVALACLSIPFSG